MIEPTDSPDPSRRRVLQGLGGLALLAAVPAPVRAGLLSPEGRATRELAFRCRRTGEACRVTYWDRGRYLPDALSEIDHLFRDVRTDEVHPIDPALLDFLYDLRLRLDSSAPVQVLSGYRSPATNEMLRRRKRGVAKHSQHLLGKAVDIRLSDRDGRQIRRAAIALGRGGVGSYGAGFTHLDTGPVRQWYGP